MTHSNPTTIIKPYGQDGDWFVTYIERGMEIFAVATCDGAVTVSRRLLGSRRVTDLTNRMTGVYGTSHASRVREVVALAERRPITPGTVAA